MSVSRGTLDQVLGASLRSLEAAGLRRNPRPINSRQDPVIRVGDREVVNFASNNYLGLASHPALAEAAKEAVAALGAGSGAARLISGSMPPHRQLEGALAELLQAPSALLFNSGYHANVGVIGALADASTEVFSDALNHASLIDGCRLSRARTHVFPHRDLEALDRQLRSSAADRKLVVSDSVFSMDGDLADVPGLRDLCDRHHAWLVLDEAHALGVLGPQGRGVAALSETRVEAISATLGKALGTFGGLVAGSETLTQWLLNQARPFIFSTALPPAVAASALAAVTLVRGMEGDERRRRLASRIAELGAGLHARGLAPAPAPNASAIFPLVVGDPARTMEVSDGLLARGLFVQGVRPPTVAPGSSRLRIALMATHSEQHIATLLAGLDAVRHLLPDHQP